MDNREFFLSRYTPLRRSYVNKVRERLEAAQMRSQPPGLNSIAWNLWHVARAEDVGVNRFVPDRGQVVDDEGWLPRLGIDVRHQGTGQTAEEATATTTQLDLEALRGYTKAVGYRTREVVDALEPDMMDRPLELARIRQVLFDEGFAHSSGAWLEKAYTAGRTRVSAWPRVWTTAFRPGGKLPVGPVGVLEDVQRRDGDRLALTMTYDGREHSGVLTWTAPPSVDDVERVLRANIGRELGAISEVDV